MWKMIQNCPTILAGNNSFKLESKTRMNKNVGKLKFYFVTIVMLNV